MLRIGERIIGKGQPCYIIAEAGVNHNGDADTAYALIDIAAAAGADAVKFQTFNPEKLVSASARKAAYQRENTGSDEPQLAMLQKLALSPDLQKSLQAYAKQQGILFLSSPFDEDSANFLDELQVPAFKVPSGEITNTPLLRHLARKNKPLLVSTGMCDLAEVAVAVETLNSLNANFGLFHCVSNYPAAPDECNLNAITTLAEEFKVPVGWSDHTLGTHIAVAAVALGATMLEKHFTLDKTLPGPDHKASLDPAELSQLVTQAREVERSLGDGIKKPQPSEADVTQVARKSLFVNKAMRAGDLLTADDIICLRPGDGISPTEIDTITGCRLNVDVEAFSPLRREALQTND